METHRHRNITALDIEKSGHTNIDGQAAIKLIIKKEKQKENKLKCKVMWVIIIKNKNEQLKKVAIEANIKERMNKKKQAENNIT